MVCVLDKAAKGTTSKANTTPVDFHESCRPRLKTLTPGVKLQVSGYRYYSPVLGRWISRDPIGEKDGPHVYAFVRNAPPHATDNDGRASYGPHVSPTCAIQWAADTKKLRCASKMLMRAKRTWKKLYPCHNPDKNGHNVIHCLANCLIASECGFKKTDVKRLLMANLGYEACTKGRERCVKWCGNDTDYLDDLDSDFKADVVGICAGLDGKECAKACKGETSSPGPILPTKCPKDSIKCCKKKHNKNPSEINVTDILNKMYPNKDYASVCGK